MSKRIIISGLTGFIGQNLEDYLSVDYETIGLSRVENQRENIFSYDQLSKEKLDHAEAFVHLAGKAHDLKNSSDDQAYFLANTALTKKVFDQFLESKCSTFIFLSSVKASADEVDGYLNESVPPIPITAYGQSKRKAEEYLLSENVGNKNVYILRPCMVHGPGNKGNLNLLYQLVKKGLPYPLGAYDNQRSFLSIENLCFSIKKLIEKTPENGIYHLADDEPLSTIRLVEIMAQELERRSRILNISKPLINLLAKLGSLFGLSINEERLQKLTENYLVSNRKIKKSLDISLPVNSEQGIRKTIRSFKDDS